MIGFLIKAFEFINFELEYTSQQVNHAKNKLAEINLLEIFKNFLSTTNEQDHDMLDIFNENLNFKFRYFFSKLQACKSTMPITLSAYKLIVNSITIWQLIF